VNTEANHFAGKDLAVKQIYSRMIDELLKFGFLRISPSKTGISLINHRHFANVVVRPSYLIVEFELSRFIDDPDRFIKVQRIGDNRFLHSLKLSEDADLSSDCLTWIRESYQTQG
jgi:hypothetical protein